MAPSGVSSIDTPTTVTSGRLRCSASSTGKVRWQGRQYAAKKSTTNRRAPTSAVSKVAPCIVGRRKGGTDWFSTGLGDEGGGGAVGGRAHAARASAAATSAPRGAFG